MREQLDESGDAKTSRPRGALGPVLLLGPALLFAAILVAEFLLRPSQESGRQLPESLPTTEYALLGDPGSTFSFREENPNVIVVNFWASWCIPCRDEMPMFDEVAAQFEKDDVIFVGVNVTDSPSDAKTFLRTHDITYTNIVDPQDSLAGFLKPFGLPRTYLFSGDGRLQRVSYDSPGWLGPVERTELVGQIDSLLD